MPINSQQLGLFACTFSIRAINGSFFLVDVDNRKVLRIVILSCGLSFLKLMENLKVGYTIRAVGQAN